jgi:hypothetical protein
MKRWILLWLPLTVPLMIGGSLIVLAIALSRYSERDSEHPAVVDAKPNFADAYISCVDMTKPYFRYQSSFDDKWAYMNSEMYDSAGVVRVRFSVRNGFNLEIQGDYAPPLARAGWGALAPSLLQRKGLLPSRIRAKLT